MKGILLILLPLAIIISCSTQQQLQKTYTGKPIELVKKDFGSPEKIISNPNDSIFIYEIQEKLNETEISQGKLTLDPIVSPPVIKTKRFYFTVRNGNVIHSRYEEAYER